MKRYFKQQVVVLILFIAASFSMEAQTVIKLGSTEVVLQSPFSIKRGPSQSVEQSKSKSFRRYYFNEFYMGFGFAVPLNRESVMPVMYGNSYNFDLGFRYFYRYSRNYAIGTTVQYSYYSYRLKNSAKDLFYKDMPRDIVKEYYRTNNIGTGLINRFYLYPFGIKRALKLDIGAYFDLSFSKSYTVKYLLDQDTHKFKYRDGSKFNPFQAGLQGALSIGSWSIYGRYRITDLFNHEEINAELPRLSIGVQLVF